MVNDSKSYRNRVLPGDKTRTPLTDEQYRQIMRPLWKQRKALERAGLCNPPRNFPCNVECGNCPFAQREHIASLDELTQQGLEIEDTVDVAEMVADALFEEQLRSVLPQLDVVDQIIVRAFVLHDINATERKCAEIISVAIGRPYSHQAVGKRIPKAAARLAELVGYKY